MATQGYMGRHKVTHTDTRLHAGTQGDTKLLRRGETWRHGETQGYMGRHEVTQDDTKYMALTLYLYIVT